MASIHSGYRKAINLPHLSGSALKVIAIISMVVDHCAYYLMEHDTLLYEGMRCFGRIAFPVFAFLVAEGFRYTVMADIILKVLPFKIIQTINQYRKALSSFLNIHFKTILCSSNRGASWPISTKSTCFGWLSWISK